MNIVVTGATGFIGRALCRTLSHDGHRLTVLTRNGNVRSDILDTNIASVEWNGRDPGPWERVLEDADAVVNLAGAPIAEGRWTTARKQLLTDSRVCSTRLLVAALSRQSAPHPIFISASGIGYYGASDDRLVDEGAARGTGFLADLCLTWEAEAMRAAEYGTRVVILRTGMVLEADGGALAKMLPPFKLFAGGPIMPGTQWVSWIHRRDHIGLIQWALETATVAGPINAVSPAPVTMRTFCETLGQVLHRPSWLPVPRAALDILLGELGTLMTTGQRVIPARAMAGGYTFHYPALKQALQSILLRTSDTARATAL